MYSVPCRYEFVVEENSPTDTKVGQVTAASDPDLPPPHDRLTFYVVNASQELQQLFRVDSDTGNIRTLQPLDREQQSIHIFIVGIRSSSASPRPSDRDVKARVKVTVDDVNDCAPVWVFPAGSNESVHVSFDFGSDGEAALATLVAADADDGDNARLTSVL